MKDQIIDPEHEQQRMEEAMALDSAAMHQRMSFDRSEQADEQMGDAKGQAINKLFAPPAYNEAASYYQTIEKAAVEMGEM